MDIVALAQALVTDFGVLGVFAATAILNASIILPLPADLIVFTAGAMSNSDILFNPITIGLFGGLGSAVGELTGYILGRGMNKLVLRKHHVPGFATAEEYFNKYGFWGIAFFSLTPLPMDIMGLFAGAVKYDVHKFFAATLLGKIPRCLLLAFAGYAGMSIVLNVFQWSI